MVRGEKEQFVGTLHAKLEKASATFLVHYQGLNVEGMNRLRGQLRRADAELKVVKNRLLKIASEETGTRVLKDAMKGPSGIAIGYGDVSVAAKALVSFSKEEKLLVIRDAQVFGRRIDPEGVKRLSELPGREVLLAQTLSAMQAVPASFVRVLSGVVTKLLFALKAIEQQKAESNPVVSC